MYVDTRDTAKKEAVFRQQQGKHKHEKGVSQHLSTPKQRPVSVPHQLHQMTSGDVTETKYVHLYTRSRHTVRVG